MANLDQGLMEAKRNKIINEKQYRYILNKSNPIKLPEAFYRELNQEIKEVFKQIHKTF